VLLRPVLADPAVQRANYRNAPVAVIGGLALLVAALAVVAGASAAVALGWLGSGDDQLGRQLALLAVLGFGLVGLLDDLIGTGDRRGFGGHLRALAGGQATTGAVKIVGGGLVAVVLAAGAGADGVAELVLDTLAIALCANLANLFDRAPGRTTKVATIGFVVLVVSAGAPGALAGPAVVVGAAVGLLPFDLGERLMLGDTGANPLGAAVGLAVVLATGPVATAVVVVVVGLLNVASERVSFSAVIDRTPPLRRLDRWGCRPERR
jgi:UDP-GlcNAc:undecaprenyl-phosphate GlcNAc-1-phosphate transferase